jgi:hypothetical protein
MVRFKNCDDAGITCLGNCDGCDHCDGLYEDKIAILITD